VKTELQNKVVRVISAISDAFSPQIECEQNAQNHTQKISLVEKELAQTKKTVSEKVFLRPIITACLQELKVGELKKKEAQLVEINQKLEKVLKETKTEKVFISCWQ
jgi:hypothetical protein